MTLDEAIAWFASLARTDEMCAHISVTEQAKEANHKSAEKHRQVAEWLMELKEYKKNSDLIVSPLLKEGRK